VTELSDESLGISRRDLLKRGAALGGAVIWVSPVVQTLGMGRAFAQTPSPVDQGGMEISYIGINVVCADPNDSFFIKWEDDAGWEMDPGNAPTCASEEALPTGVNGMALGFSVAAATDESCRSLFIPSSIDALGVEIEDLEADCEVTVWVKAGEGCRTYSEGELNIGGNTLVCSLPA
jgi:hypothetical protein